MPTFFNASAGRNERLAPSIIDSEPLDEFSQQVADWIDHFTQGLNPDHVEASTHDDIRAFHIDWISRSRPNWAYSSTKAQTQDWADFR